MSIKKTLPLIFIAMICILAGIVPVCAENNTKGSISVGISFNNTEDPVSIEFSGNDELNLTASNEYKNYMRSFSSNIILLIILAVSGTILLLLKIAGRKYSEQFYYLERFYLRVILIPTYSIMGILLVLISLFSIAMTGGMVDPSAETLTTFVFSLIIFMYAATSLLLAYSVATKKVYSYILAFEIFAPLLILLFSFADTDTEGFLDMIINTMFFLILASIPLMHTRMLGKRKKSSATINFLDGNISQSGGNTLPLNEEQEAILNYSQKHNSFPPELSERYMNTCYIGKGGTARIFRTKRRKDGKTVAVKIPLNFDERTGRSFLKEMNIWKELSHKNIVEVYSVNILPIPYVEMEYCKGSLAEIDKPASSKFSLSLIADIADGLLYAHKKGMLHRDIKPQNILIAEDCTPKITDWGLGKIIGDGSDTKTIAFSLNYASPEQVAPGIFGHTDKRTDIFQLGVVFYELLTGILPFSGEGIGEFSGAIINTNPAPPSAITPVAEEFDKIIMKCLEKHPENRYQSIDELISDLRKLQEKSA